MGIHRRETGLSATTCFRAGLVVLTGVCWLCRCGRHAAWSALHRRVHLLEVVGADAGVAVEGRVDGGREQGVGEPSTRRHEVEGLQGLLGRDHYLMCPKEDREMGFILVVRARPALVGGGCRW